MHLNFLNRVSLINRKVTLHWVRKPPYDPMLKLETKCQRKRRRKHTCQKMKLVLIVWATASLAHVSRLSFITTPAK